MCFVIALKNKINLNTNTKRYHRQNKSDSITDRQYNGQKKRDKKTDNCRHNILHRK